MAAEYCRVQKKKIFSEVVRSKKFSKLRFAPGTKKQIFPNVYKIGQ